MTRCAIEGCNRPLEYFSAYCSNHQSFQPEPDHLRCAVGGCPNTTVENDPAYPYCELHDRCHVIGCTERIGNGCSSFCWPHQTHASVEAFERAEADHRLVLWFVRMSKHNDGNLAPLIWSVDADDFEALTAAIREIKKADNA